MCPVQWHPPSPKPTHLPFMRCPPDQHVGIIEPPNFHACIALHFPENGRGSVPCMGDGECRHHHLALKVHAYTVALVYSPGKRSFSAMILDLGFAEGELATTDYRGMFVRVGRRKMQDSRTDIVVRDLQPAPPESPIHTAEPIDVRPHLMRRWGLFEEATRLEREAYYEQQRLPFDADLDAKGVAS
jgi:hypothetical protein